MANFRVNGVEYNLDIEPEMPLLWALRNELGLNGTKFSCGVAACGACTVHVNGNAARSCVTPVSAVEGADIVTIEGLAASAIEGLAASAISVNASSSPASEGTLSTVQQAWIEHQIPQCGYCQSGMLMAVSALLRTNASPSDEEIDSAVSNICRCGTYPRVRKAIKSLIQA